MIQEAVPRKCSRTLVVGLDGGSLSLMQQWASEGLLPTFERLMRDGHACPLRSTVNFHSASAWSTFATGVSPATHGVYHFVNRVPGQYAATAIHSEHIQSPTLWELLTARDVPLLALNVPMTYPVKPVSGTQVAGWLAPTIHSKGATYPAEVAEQISKEFGRYPMFPDGRRFVLSGHYEAAARRLKASLETKLRVAEHYLRNTDWAFAVVVLPETDAAQHWFWHFIDSKSPEHSDDLRRRWGNPIRDAYVAVDQWLGRQLDLLDGDVQLLVMSDHGAALQSRGELYLRELLIKAGVLTPRVCIAKAACEAAMGAMDQLPHGWRHRFARMAPPSVSGSMLGKKAIGDNVWRRTKAFASATWDPWINLQGREPQGVVESKDYDEICECLKTLLASAEDVVSGRPAVAKVTQTRKHLQGKHIDQIPDLAVQWTDQFAIEGLTARVNGKRVTATRAEGRRATSFVTGAHTPEGVLIALGDRFDGGLVCAEPGIVDIAPTVLELLGLPVPLWMEGRSLLGDKAKSSPRQRRRKMLDLPRIARQPPHVLRVAE